jgi:DNA-3-methyladenine glycosylase II
MIRVFFDTRVLLASLRSPQGGSSMDHRDGHNYRRMLPWTDLALLLAVVQPGPPDAPRLRVMVSGEAIRDAVAPAVSRILARTLGVRRDLAVFYRLAASDPQIDPLAARSRGMKPPGFPTLFECLINAGSVLIRRVARTASLCVNSQS